MSLRFICSGVMRGSSIRDLANTEWVLDSDEDWWYWLVCGRVKCMCNCDWCISGAAGDAAFWWCWFMLWIADDACTIILGDVDEEAAAVTDEDSVTMSLSLCTLPAEEMDDERMARNFLCGL